MKRRGNGRSGRRRNIAGSTVIGFSVESPTTQSTFKRMDKKALLQQLHRLPLQERMDIVDSLLDSVAFDEAPPPVTPEQMLELNARLEHHRRNPDEPGVTLEEIRRKLFPG